MYTASHLAFIPTIRPSPRLLPAVTKDERTPFILLAAFSAIVLAVVLVLLSFFRIPFMKFEINSCPALLALPLAFKLSAAVFAIFLADVLALSFPESTDFTKLSTRFFPKLVKDLLDTFTLLMDSAKEDNFEDAPEKSISESPLTALPICLTPSTEAFMFSTLMLENF